MIRMTLKLGDKSSEILTIASHDVDVWVKFAQNYNMGIELVAD